MVSGGRPGGGGMMPPGITPGPGTKIMPMPGLLSQIGSMVGCPSADVVVTELAVRPLILTVLVAKGPDSVLVWGPVVMGPFEDMGAGPPSSVDARAFAG
jgi:hypothetical protein